MDHEESREECSGREQPVSPPAQPLDETGVILGAGRLDGNDVLLGKLGAVEATWTADQSNSGPLTEFADPWLIASNGHQAELPAPSSGFAARLSAFRDSRDFDASAVG
ncbi:hypothetical protein [Sinomonas gamaensis]|jgi:hypothetical protein|uniref:hypothetical protein n=1 Tax=Sinomonas gamaensis TaxID=2565624 RepID=UPI0014872E0E|nr:hypothetical protein [Sinomonas gamaensis]